jgi:hypothetical protein
MLRELYGPHLDNEREEKGPQKGANGLLTIMKKWRIPRLGAAKQRRRDIEAAKRASANFRRTSSSTERMFEGGVSWIIRAISSRTAYFVEILWNANFDFDVLLEDFAAGVKISTLARRILQASAR